MDTYNKNQKSNRTLYTKKDPMKFFNISIFLSITALWLSPLNATEKCVQNIGVIGVGRLGICTALCFERAGYNVLGLDVNPSYTECINKRSLRSHEPRVSEYLSESTHFRATTSLDELINFADIYFIVVATPSTPDKEAYDHSMLSNVLYEINKRKVQNKHIVICCTVFPGYIRNVGSYLLQDCLNTTLSYNPEFIAQGSIIENFEHPDAVLIGEGSCEAGDILENIYRNTCKNSPKICRMSPESAEIAKLSVNCFVTTKIAYANMVGDIADNTPGASKNDILNFVGQDSRVGTKCLKPGYGFGGPCFPRDNRALGSYAQTVGIEPYIPQATDISNKDHALFMTEQLNHCTRSCDIIMFEDVAYKNGCPVAIIEESQKLVVACALAKAGKTVIIRDRAIIIDEVKKKFGNLFEYETY
jgi:UDPglucose 6-dehydrogenase